MQRPAKLTAIATLLLSAALLGLLALRRRA